MTSLTHDLDFVLRDYFNLFLDQDEEGSEIVTSEYLVKYLWLRGYEIKKIEEK